MKTFIWERVGNCTDCWHTEGGFVVIAESLEEARELINTTTSGHIDERETPDLVYECEATEKRVFTFPDAGCC